MHSKILLFLLVIVVGFNSAFADKTSENVTKALLFLPGVFLEEYFASIFDEEGGVDESVRNVFIPYVHTKQIHKDYERYIVQTLAQYVKEVNRYKLKSADKENRYLKTASIEVTNKVAKEKGCRYVLYINISKKDDGMLFAFIMKDSETNNTLWHDEYIALIPEDVAPILFRVANSMGTAKKGSHPKSFYDTDSPIYVNEATLEQVIETQKTEAEKQLLNGEANEKKIYTHFGISTFPNIIFRDAKPMAGIGVNAWHDFEWIILEGTFEARSLISENYKISLIGLYMWAPVFHTDANSPYVGGGLGVSSTKIDDVNEKSGITGNIGAGYMFNRFKFLNLRFCLKYFKNFYATEGHKAQGLGIDVMVGL